MRSAPTFPFIWMLLLAVYACSASPDNDGREGFVEFESVQTDLFAEPGAQPNAWADYDNDGDLDLFVGRRGGANRLYRNDDGFFLDVAADVGLNDTTDTRAAAWGDYDADGDLDLYIGFPAQANTPNRLFRNEGDGEAFFDVAEQYGVDLVGTTRQPVWVDYDQDGDVDLFVAFRDQPNRLFRNDGRAFVDVTDAAGIGDPRRTVGVVWFDMDEDGDLDLHVSNQNGDEDSFFRYDGEGRFTDVAAALGMNWPDRGDEYGSVGPAVTDYDNDGDLDLFIATYGPDVLWENRGGGFFVNVAPGTPLGPDHHSTTAAWGDVDNDGRPDLFVAAYLNSVAEEPDNLFANTPTGFKDMTPSPLLAKGASHGVSFADFDQDGDLDLALANNNAAGTHPLYRNLLAPEVARQSVQVAVLSANGRWTKAGSEVRLFDEATDQLLGTRLTDTGGGYCSQGATPVHFGLGEGVERVRVEVTSFREGQREITSVNGIVVRDQAGRPVPVRVPG